MKRLIFLFVLILMTVTVSSQNHNVSRKPKPTQPKPSKPVAKPTPKPLGKPSSKPAAKPNPKPNKQSRFSGASLCPDSNHPHMIDLGLPSGTLWACCNVGADKPEDYGGYFAWGETRTKSNYNEFSYLYYKNSSYQSIGSDIAGTQYDVAHVKWGGNWVMPSLDQIEELGCNCTYQWTTVNHVQGGKFTSKKNGASIFLPAASGRGGDFDDSGYYWSSTQSPVHLSNACDLYFNSSDAYWDYGYYCGRGFGRTVRPVSRN